MILVTSTDIGENAWLALLAASSRVLNQAFGEDELSVAEDEVVELLSTESLAEDGADVLSPDVDALAETAMVRPVSDA